MIDMMNLVKELNKVNYEVAVEKLQELGYKLTNEYNDKDELIHDEDWAKDNDMITFTCEYVIGEDEDEVDYEGGYWNIYGER